MTLMFSEEENTESHLKQPKRGQIIYLTWLPVSYNLGELNWPSGFSKLIRDSRFPLYLANHFFHSHALLFSPTHPTPSGPQSPLRLMVTRLSL
jgi:hypothetical protein